MYKLEYLPVAQGDMVEIVHYVSQELKNPQAAERLTVQLTDAIESILAFPYACPVYAPLRALKHEYRKLIIQNYMMLYWIDDEKQVITVARVTYARRDYSRMLALLGENPNDCAPLD